MQIRTKHILSLLIIFTLSIFNVGKAQVMGKVIDSKTQKPLEGVNVFYPGTNYGVQTDLEGVFVLKEDSIWNTLTVSSIGYETKTVKIKRGKSKDLVVKLTQDSKMLSEVTVKAKRHKYNRIGNPAVELMKKVIESKKATNIYNHDFLSFSKYERLSFYINDLSDKVFDEGEMKRLAFLKDHVERCKETEKLVLPLTVSETTKETYYRKTPKVEKSVVTAQSDKGINELINTGEIISTMLKDFFVDINIYDNECRLLQNRFKSPIADNAITFYRYYIQDTLIVDGEKVIELGYLPNNQQDFGFSGLLYITTDSTYQVTKAVINIPRNSDVNFVDNMVITQSFVNLPSGERVMDTNDMLIELTLASFINKLMVKHTVKNYGYSFDEIQESVFKSIKGDNYIKPDATLVDENYWAEARKIELSESETKIGSFIDNIKHVRGFNWFIVGMKVLVENFIETSRSTETNKFDIGPINTMYSYNHYDKSRFRFSGLTTAHFNPHLFAEGYVAYGTAHKNFYGRAKLTYAFNKPKYLTQEYPKNNLSISYFNDIIDPRQKYLSTDKDNVFMSLNSGAVDQFSHTWEKKILYDKEWLNGLRFYTSFTHTKNEAVDQLFYQRLGTTKNDLDVYTPSPNSDNWMKDIQTSEINVKIAFEPHGNYVNTKQHRLRVNKDAPTYYISHTLGLNGVFGSQWNYHISEIGVSKRIWLSSWGYIDTDIKAGAQWNKVPFPMLIHPASNQTYVTQDGVFGLMNNYEFLNDRWATAMIHWDMNGKIFNRIPLLHRLKLREMIGFKMLWGALSDKNNPSKSNFSDSDIFFFPGRFNANGEYISNTRVMDPKRPYFELSIGVHNIFKLFRVDFVQRFNYNSDIDVSRYGIRFGFRPNF